ncbi:hypothetical protein EVG20_g1499 [Dentipellis fragilis]|uniref:DUF6533 domain-containing protein n=1 Tax=Dentipellis fragilis TaxID=205917 RepID=A0A4Y9ZBJ7_9AGAM|nr:hypothetical protein EVG20_g1499 [Dentipellis fragilis]
MDPIPLGLQEVTSEIPGMMGVRYLSGVAVTLVVWDTCLTMSSEVQLIWCLPFTRVKAIYLILRYLALSCQVWQCFALLIMRVYTLWDHRPRVLQTLFAAFSITFMSVTAFVIISLWEMIGSVVYDAEVFHTCLIKSKPTTWVGAWASQVAFDVCVFILTLLNTASRPRVLGAKIIADLLRDGGLFYLTLFSLRLLNAILTGFNDVSFLVLGFFFDWSMVTILVCRLVLRVEYMRLPSYKRHHIEADSEPATEDFAMYVMRPQE